MTGELVMVLQIDRYSATSPYYLALSKLLLVFKILYSAASTLI